MILRPFGEKDWPDYLRLSRAFYATSAVDHQVPERHFELTFQEALKTNPLMGAWAISEPGGPMVGFVLLAFTWSNEAGGRVAWLEELFLDESLRGQGLGRWCLKELMKMYKDEVSMFRLEVTPTNQAAIRLYRSLGFEMLGYLQMVRVAGY